MTMLNTMPLGRSIGNRDDGWVAWDSLPKTDFRNARYRVFHSKSGYVYIQIDMYHTVDAPFTIPYPDGYRSRGSSTFLYLLPDVGPDEYPDVPTQVNDNYDSNTLSVTTTYVNTYVGPIAGFVAANRA